MNKGTILIVEDEAIVALDLKLQLQELGYAVSGIAASGEQALDLLARQLPHLVLMDIRLQGAMDGIATAQRIHDQYGIPLIFLTSHSDDDTVQRAARTAPYGYLTKPYQIREVRAGIEVALTKASMAQQLREADRWFAHTLQCVADGVIVTDLDSRVRSLNPAAEDLTGWMQEDAVGRPVGDIVPVRPSTLPGAAAVEAGALVAAVLDRGRPTPVHHAQLLLRRDGGGRYVDLTAGPVNDERGRRLGAVLVLRDAAPRVAQEAQLRASESRFRNAFDHAPLGMALVSLQGDFIQVNGALCTLLGRSRDEVLSSSHARLTHPEDAAHETRRLQELESDVAGVVQFEKRYLRPGDAPAVWTLVSVSALRDSGRVSCYLYQVHDLTEQRIAAERLAALADERLRREASEQASAAKSEFLSRASHELRTPLNAVMGFAQLLQMQEQQDHAEVVRYAQQIHAAGEHLLSLVNDLLDIGRVAQGTLQLETAPMLLAPVVAQTLDLLQGEAAAHHVTVDAQVDGAIQVQGHARRLLQVLLNVVSNAIKYNQTGGTVRLHASPAGDRTVRLTVQDSGIGMTAEQLERLFQPFDRLGAERTEIPGTGLGLLIAHGLTAEMGGTLGVSSAPGTGTTVSLTLPAVAVA